MNNAKFVAQSNRLKQQKRTFRTQKTIRERTKSNVWQNICKSKIKKKTNIKNEIFKSHKVWSLSLLFVFKFKHLSKKSEKISHFITLENPFFPRLHSVLTCLKRERERALVVNPNELFESKSNWIFLIENEKRCERKWEMITNYIWKFCLCA